VSELGQFNHEPVLLRETIEALNVREDGLYIDCTVGGGGHSLEIAKLLNFRKGGLICFDRDKYAIEAARDKLADYPVSFINANFSEMAELTGFNPGTADGILMDLGVSSEQLDNAKRGFSFHSDAPLDMRMGVDSEQSAYDVVNGYPEERLIKILFEYGEEKFARGIARGIVNSRTKSPIRTTFELAEVIRNNVPLSVRNAKNPCRKTFQAIRIEVNDELGSIEKGVAAAFDMLKKGGRLAVITFHSIEDRLVKNMFGLYASGCDCPKELPLCVCGKVPRANEITRKPIIPGEQEISRNRRARSAKLRVIERI